MSATAILFMLLTMAAAGLFIWWGFDPYPERPMPVLDAEGLEQPQSRFHSPSPLARRDLLPLLLITAIYALVAFWGLGDKAAPQSYRVFREGESETLMLDEPAALGCIRYFTGADTGRYRLEYSMDGEQWEKLPDIEQSYDAVLKWKKFWPENAPLARYLRLTAKNGPLHLGELAIWGENGEEIGLSESALTDERELVPLRSSYMNSSYFDEIYHVRTAWEHIEQIWPYEISHPPLGKIILGLGIRLFGLNPFGWRFMGVLLGVLMLPLLYLFLKNLTGSTWVTACTATVFAFDFMHYTQTRLATIDTYSVFFILLMFYFFYRYYALPPDAPPGKALPPLFLSGLCFGLGVASKWTVVFGGAGLALLWSLRQGLVLRWRHIHGLRQGLSRYLLPTVFWSILFFVLIPATVFCLSYYPYAQAKQVGVLSVDFIQLVLENVDYMFSYHSGLTATHPYQSEWWQWILDLRPILYYLDDFGDGTKSAFAAFGNPLFWWTGLGAMVCMAVKALRGDKLALIPLLGWLSCLAPWVLVPRCAFVYHYFPCTVFLALALGRLGQDICSKRERGFLWPAALAGGCALLFVLFYPALSGIRVASSFGYNWLRWFGGMWPF